MGNFGNRSFGGRSRDRDDDRGRGRGRDRDDDRGRGGGRDRYGGSSRGFGRRPTEMHDVTCDKCGKECQVPFRPTGDKPVLCSDCFSKTDRGSSRNNSSSRGSSESSGISQDQFKQLNTKLDKIIAILDNLELDVDEDGEEELDDEDSEDDEDGEEESDEDEAELEDSEEELDETK